MECTAENRKRVLDPNCRLKIMGVKSLSIYSYQWDTEKAFLDLDWFGVAFAFIALGSLKFMQIDLFYF